MKPILVWRQQLSSLFATKYIFREKHLSFNLFDCTTNGYAIEQNLPWDRHELHVCKCRLIKWNELLNANCCSNSIASTCNENCFSKRILKFWPLRRLCKINFTSIEFNSRKFTRVTSMMNKRQKQHSAKQQRILAVIDCRTEIDFGRRDYKMAKQHSENFKSSKYSINLDDVTPVLCLSSNEHRIK